MPSNGALGGGIPRLLTPELPRQSASAILIQESREVPDRVFVHARRNPPLVIHAVLQTSRLPASVPLRDPQVALNDLFPLGTVNSPQAALEFCRGHNDKVGRAPFESAQHENPEIGLRRTELAPAY
jgi:hypothetical protein